MQAPEWQWAGPLGSFPALPQTIIIILVMYVSVKLIARYLEPGRPLVGKIAKLAVVASGMASLRDEPTVASIGRGFARFYTWIGGLIGSSGVGTFTNQAFAVVIVFLAVFAWYKFSTPSMAGSYASAQAMQHANTGPMGPPGMGMGGEMDYSYDEMGAGGGYSSGIIGRLRSPALLMFFAFAVLAAAVYIEPLGVALSWIFFNPMSFAYIAVITLANTILNFNFSYDSISWAWAAPVGTFPALPLPVAIALATMPVLWLVRRYVNPQGRFTAWLGDAAEYLLFASAVAACRDVPIIATIGGWFDGAFNWLRDETASQGAAFTVGFFTFLVLVIIFVAGRLLARRWWRVHSFALALFAFVALVASVNLDGFGSVLSWIALNVISGAYLLIVSLINYVLGFTFFVD